MHHRYQIRTWAFAVVTVLGVATLASAQQPLPEVDPALPEDRSVLALLETMKVFQKVKCPTNGKVAEILVESETPLKDDDLMFIIEAD